MAVKAVNGNDTGKETLVKLCPVEPCGKDPLDNRVDSLIDDFEALWMGNGVG
jgi:hypothetical protein